MPTKDFGRAIKKARVREGLTQGELARKSGISQPRMSRIENSHELPPPDVASVIMKNLNSSKIGIKYCANCPIARYGCAFHQEPTRAAMSWLVEKIQDDLERLDKTSKAGDKKAFMDCCCRLHSTLDVLLNKFCEE